MVDDNRLMRIRVVGGGPNWWQLRVEDADSGKALPAVKVELILDAEAEMQKAIVTLQVFEIDAELYAERRDLVTHLEKNGEEVRITREGKGR